MAKETLSDKIDDRNERLLVRDVREFIKNLKENKHCSGDMMNEISKLAGEKLI